MDAPESVRRTIKVNYHRFRPSLKVTVTHFESLTSSYCDLV